MSRSILPPRKREWMPGRHQVGLFIRFPDGDVIEVSAFDTKSDEAEAALALLRLLSRKSAEREQADIDRPATLEEADR